MLEPDPLSGGAHDGLDRLLVLRLDRCQCKQSGDASPDQRRRVGHGAHEALAAEPSDHAVCADAGGHAQVQRPLGVRARLQRRLRKDLGFDCPHHHRGALQAGIGLIHHLHVKLRLQPIARLR